MYITVYILTYQNLLLIYTDLTPENRNIYIVPFSSFLWDDCFYVLYVYRKLSHRLLYSSILENLCFQVTRWHAVPVTLCTFFMGVTWIQESVPWNFWWHKIWLAILDRVLSTEFEESSSGGVFPIDEICSLQDVML